MDLCYCYFKDNSLSLNIERLDTVDFIPHTFSSPQDIPKSGIYWIELDELTKENLGYISALTKKQPLAHIYIFAPQSLHKPLLFKFSLFFNIKDVIDTALPLEKLKNSLSLMLQQFHQAVHTKNTVDFSKNIYENVSFCTFTKGKITFSSDLLKDFLGISDRKEIEKRLPSIEDLQESLITSSISDTIAVENKEGEYWKCFYQLSGTKDYFMLTLVPFEKFSNKALDIELNHRFQTIEWLKDRLVETHSSKSKLSIAMITIENNYALYKSFSYLEYHEFLKAFLQKLSSACSFQGYMAHWESDSYLLAYENDAFEVLESSLELLSEELTEVNPKITPIIRTTLWEVKKKPLPQVVSFLDRIVEDSLAAEDTASHRIKLITSRNVELSEEEEITAQMHHCMLNNIPLKLLNIYKGLCIYTGSKVLKIKGDDIYLHCENLQGYAIKQTYETVIHGPIFSHEIKAKIKFINIKENYLIANKVHYLSTSANNRQYTRVQPNIRTPIFMVHEKNTYQGEILDISLKSLAFQCRQSMLDVKKGAKVKLNFKLPHEEADFGFVALECEGEIVHTALMDTAAAMKVVVMLELEEDSETHLMRYMYERQKELIKELKKVVKQNT